MNEQACRIRLADEGFKDILVVEREANGAVTDHAHPFEAKALILRGEIRIRTGGTEKTYGVGEVFHLQANQAHEEYYGPEGVSYLVGRR